jgi:hypothetical protein
MHRTRLQKSKSEKTKKDRRDPKIGGGCELENKKNRRNKPAA